jgi:hypothetical protein
MLTKTNHVVSVEALNLARFNIPAFDSKLTINQPTGNFFYEPWEIKTEFKNTVWEEILSSLESDIGEARLIKLEPQQAYSSHADIDDRWHLSLESDQSYLIDLDDMVVHNLESNGTWYFMDAGRIHTAGNFGGTTRVQLVVRKLLLKNKILNPVKVIINPVGDTTWYRYNFDLIVSPWLNRANKVGDISNFNFQGNTITFDISQSALACFKEIVTPNFKVSYV